MKLAVERGKWAALTFTQLTPDTTTNGGMATLRVGIHGRRMLFPVRVSDGSVRVVGEKKEGGGGIAIDGA